MMSSHRRAKIASVAVLATLAAACSETTEPAVDGTPSSTESSATDTPAASATPGELTDLGEADALTQYAIDNIGGTHAKVVGGTPYKIGLANGNDFFPDVQGAAEAAAEFINAELGGVDGRPLEVVTCNVASAEDAEGCAAEFANDPDIQLVVVGSLLAGNGALYSGLNRKTGVIISLPLDVADYTTGVAVAYNSGGLGLGIGSGLFVASVLQPKTAALVVTDDAAGRGGAGVFTPILNQAGIDLKTVFVPPTATSPEVASALQATGAESVDVVILGLFEQGCIAAADAITTLGIEPTVVTTAGCWGSGMTDYLKSTGSDLQVPDGWYFSNNGWNPFTPNEESGRSTYDAKIVEYGGGDPLGTGSSNVWAAIMAGTTVINDIGVANADYAGLKPALSAFTGPVTMQAGRIECDLSPIFGAICAPAISISQYLDGEWIAVAEGDNALDISPAL